ncbi:MAG: alpha/beta fold hydrolase [Phycisphaeraceae bacterium]|nr:MAG: alpha/beta fold hydrolase [Phycisphaeraceae bacterium]
MPDLLPLLVLGLALSILWLIAFTMRSLARPPRRTEAWAIARSRPSDPSELAHPRSFESIRIAHNAPESAPAWIIAGDNPAGPVLIFCHGWGESKMDILQRLDAVAPLCSKMISWDMPGHGEAPRGSTPLGASEWMILEDLIHLAQGEDLEARTRQTEELEATLEDDADWDTHFDTPPKPGAPKVVLWGYSLGAGIAIDLAANRTRRVSAIIAESPYRLPHTPARNMLALKRLPWRINLAPAMFLLGLSRSRGPRWTGFDRAALARDITCPLLVIHGDMDEISPPEDARDIARAAPNATLITLSGANHFDLWTDPKQADARERATRAIADFIRFVAAS